MTGATGVATMTSWLIGLQCCVLIKDYCFSVWVAHRLIISPDTLNIPFISSLVKWGSQVNVMIPKTVRVHSVGLHLLHFPWKMLLGINLFYQCCNFSIFTRIKCNYHAAYEEALKVIRSNIHSTRNGEKNNFVIVWLTWTTSGPTTQKSIRNRTEPALGGKS